MGDVAYLRRWDLCPDGDPVVTRSGRLLPVRWRGRPVGVSDPARFARQAAVIAAAALAGWP